MKDLRGVEIQEGDIVSFVYRWSKSGELCHGKVVGFTTQMVKINFYAHSSDRTSNYMPHNLCVVQQPKETKMKEL